MKNPVSSLLACLLLLTAAPAPAFAQRESSNIRPSSPRCEYLVSPLAIDNREPRLSWIIDSNVRGTKQRAYQIIVASSLAGLARNKGDLWDTGKVTSSQTIQTAYRGKPLGSRQQCFWKVRVWDQNDRPSTWSKPEQWAMGLMEPTDWSAQWTGDKIGRAHV